MNLRRLICKSRLTIRELRSLALMVIGLWLVVIILVRGVVGCGLVVRLFGDLVED